MPRSSCCPDCGSELSSEPAIQGLCPQCLLSLALEESELEGQKTLEGTALGRVVADRYQMRELLGRGGMGEVWRAFDLKLRIDVALKALLPERLSSEQARELLRQEVRSAREVVSSNVCRIFDLVVEDDQELVSMEFIDGVTLAETLRDRGPLGIEEAREIASQFLSGLEAIHQAALVHRDFKPENVMVTRSGRVVVMDFGLAKGRDRERTGTISGTPAYMAPEQARGDVVDARADIFSAGVVLAEMMVVGSARARQELWEKVREIPPRVPDGHWGPVLKRALALEPDSRYPTAQSLARALEELTLRLPGFEDRHPYPGLASFTAEEKEYFFGREVDVEAVWRKLKRPRLLALIGPSGAGKSSFLRAGLVPTVPQGWSVLLSTPGYHPLPALAEALLPSFAGNMQAIQSFLHFQEPETAVSLFSAWRRKSEHALVIVDQFEELFTLNPPEVQEAFASLLGRLVVEADIHVLLSLRDDFLFHCQKHESLAPVFSELTPLGTLSESALRRALVQPALACGYRFEDEALVEEMVSEVSRERGVLPLLAFAASRLWEKRDREKGLLTREAYQEIGGVAGALAQHAEETLERIGTQRTPLVRELFRNLVTAQGTRASRDVQELLSIFPKEEERRAADEVLRELVAARLLTSYETSVEIIHESLLSAWPRLVRWQTQDTDGALLRDQLRQAAHLWEERGRSEDLLWTGSSYREFSLWRERYTGGLSTTEEDFARSMSGLANRRRRRKRMAVSAVVVFLTVGLGIMGALWRRSETQALRAEASKLLAIGQLQMERHPTGALAYAIKSLELADTEEARFFALRVLQSGPVGLQSPVNKQHAGLEALLLAFSPNGEWLAIGGFRKAEIRHRDGREPIVLQGEYPSAGNRALHLAFAPDGRTLVTNRWGDLRWWSVPEGRPIREVQLENGRSLTFARGAGFFTSTTVGEEEVVRFWPFDGGESRWVGSADALNARDVDAAGESMAYALGSKVYLRSLRDWASGPELFAEHSSPVRDVAFHPSGDRVAVSDESGEIRIWRVPESESPLRVLGPEEDTSDVLFSPGGKWLAASGKKNGLWVLRLWDLSAPKGAAPLEVRADSFNFNQFAFDPTERWLVTNQADHTFYWPLGETYPRVLEGHGAFVDDVAFTPDGGTLLSVARDATLRSWPMDPASPEQPRVLLRTGMTFPSLALDPRGATAVISASGGRVLAVPIEGGPVRELKAFSEETVAWFVAISPDGRRVAANTNRAPVEERFIPVWDLESGRLLTKLSIPGAGDDPRGLSFVDDDHLLAGGTPMVLFDLRDGTGKQLSELNLELLALSRRGRFAFANTGHPSDIYREVVRVGLNDGAVTTLPTLFGAAGMAVDAAETLLASGGFDGTVRVGPISATEPHLFFGHRGASGARAFSPDGRWLASGGRDQTIRLWPVPDVTQTPPHKRPRQEFLAMLRSWTNLRVVPDSNSSSGWSIDADPFPGWAKLPTW